MVRRVRFGMGRNRHDGWLRFCGLYAEPLTAAGLPKAIAYNEHRFRDLLREGTAAGRGVAASLSGLSNAQWSALEPFVAVFFSEFESYAPLDLFPAFRREAERRGRPWLPSGRPLRDRGEGNKEGATREKPGRTGE
jgi:hypothetical protein